MRSIPGRRRLLFLLANVLPGVLLASDIVTVAVASNFAKAAADISAAFTRDTGVPIRISHGSTGKLYAQILNGAPFDVFLAADTERAALLERSGLIVAGSRRTYATGSLVLWSRDEKLRGRDCLEVLAKGDYDHVALANPATAPYGSAARQFLAGAGLWVSASSRAVYGENIAQTLQFVATGNANLGFIARSQTVNTALPVAACTWPVPVAEHAPLHQQSVLLKRAGGNPGARLFADFLMTPAARAIIRRHGYEVFE